MNASQTEGRRYRLLDLIGRGGFGNVYRARLEGPAGFTKEVAIKLVRNEDVSLDEIARFRDEARILGLVRDRAIVGVDPPIRLGGRMALVMEYVDGASCHRLLQLGPIPPRPALEIVQEIARALHKVYVQPGPDGQPLHLIHRDLKPANVQITPEGDVKLLDFGIARARFEARETRTSGTLGGTLGYIAPERLRGIEGPEGDIFSLGVLLHVLVTTERATRLPLVGTDTPPLDEEASPLEGELMDCEPDERDAKFIVPRTPDVERVVALAARMRHPDPAKRPTARAVEIDCAAISASLVGPSLRQWAAAVVPQVPPLSSLLDQEDDRIGQVYTESVEITAASVERKPSPLPPATETAPSRTVERQIALMLAALVAFAALGSTAGLGTGLAVAAATWVWPDFGRTVEVLSTPLGEEIEVLEPLEIGAPQAPEEAPEEEARPAPEAAGDGEADAAAAPSEAEEKAPQAPSGRTASKQRERPAPSAPLPEPVLAVAPPQPQPGTEEPEVEIVGVTFLSDPPGASIYLNGVLVGRTPLRDHPLSAGSYSLSLQRDGRSIERTVRLGGRRGSTHFEWRGDQLLAQ